MGGDKGAPRIMQQEILPLLREKAQEENRVENILRQEILPFLQEKVEEEENILEILNQEVLSTLKTKAPVPKLSKQEIYEILQGGEKPSEKTKLEKDIWGTTIQNNKILVNPVEPEPESEPEPGTPTMIFSYNTNPQQY